MLFTHVIISVSYALRGLFEFGHDLIILLFFIFTRAFVLDLIGMLSHFSLFIYISNDHKDTLVDFL